MNVSSFIQVRHLPNARPELVGQAAPQLVAARGRRVQGVQHNGRAGLQDAGAHDLNGMLWACGLGIAPADAAEEAKAAADYVTTRPGGRGCIREGIEMIMKAQGKWVFDEDHFDQIF